MSAKIHQLPVINDQNMDNGDFSTLARELGAFLGNIILDRSLKSGETMTTVEINKIKGSMFTASLNTIFYNTSPTCEPVRAYVLDNLSGNKNLAKLILEETDVYPAETGFMLEPLTMERDAAFTVLSNGEVDMDAAWRLLFYFLQQKFASPSATAAQKELEHLEMTTGEDPNGLAGRIISLVKRVNRARPVDKPAILDSNSATYLLTALPQHLAGMVRERLTLAVGGHNEYTLEQVTDVAQIAYNDLKAFHDQVLRNRIDHQNAQGYIDSHRDGPTRSALNSLFEQAQGLPGKRATPKPPPATKAITPAPNRPAAPLAPPPRGGRLNDAGKKLINQLTGGIRGSSYNTTNEQENVTKVCAQNVGGPNGTCVFCHNPLSQFHNPNLPCHISGRTSLYPRWVNQGNMPRPLLHLRNMLIVNHDRIEKGQPPLTKYILL